MISLLKNLSEIPITAYQGYIWYSDQKRPITLIENPLPSWPNQDEKVFVIEAMLYNCKDNVSYHVIHNGQYIIQEFDLNKAPSTTTIEIQRYLPYRISEIVEKIKFGRIWEAQTDELCANILVMMPISWVFLGFDLKS